MGRYPGGWNDTLWLPGPLGGARVPKEYEVYAP